MYTYTSISTSQAAGVCEALELDSKLLLFDEDTCATNFMVCVCVDVCVYVCV